jgi:chemotaxis signal transduction protein
MSDMTKHEIVDRILELERELFGLHRRLDDHASELPAGTIEALEVIVEDSPYAILTGTLREVVPMMWCQPMVDTPGWVLGTVQYGEDVVPVIDLKCRLGGERFTPHPSLKIILVDSIHLIGLVVSDIGGIVSFRPEQVAPPPTGIPQARFLVGAIPWNGGASTYLLSIDTLTRETKLDHG